MVDYQSRYRLYGHGYTAPDVRYSVQTFKELYHDRAPYLFNRRPKGIIFVSYTFTKNLEKYYSGLIVSKFMNIYDVIKTK